MPTISVLMGIYNEQDKACVAAAIDSILGQSFHDLELIICDDGSRPGLYGWLEAYCRKDSRIRLLRNRENRGLAYALNRCLRHAKGRYAARMDADDVSKPQRLERQYLFLEGHPEYALVGCSAKLIDAGGVWGVRRMEERPGRRSFLKTSPFIHPSVLIRTEVLRELGGYSQRRDVRRVEDYELFMRMYARGYRGYNLPEELLCYREGRQSYGKRKYRYRVNECRARLRGFRELGIGKGNVRYAMKPLAVGMVPAWLMQGYRRKKYMPGPDAGACPKGGPGKGTGRRYQRLSSLFIHYVLWVAQEARRRRIGRLYFFTREGEFFKELYDIFAGQGLLGEGAPKAEILEVSRMSTFLPSLREVSIQELMRLWRQYPQQSIKTMCRSLHIEAGQIQEYAARHGIRTDELMQGPWKDGRMARMFADKDFIRVMERLRDEKKELITCYLAQKGWAGGEKGRIGVVDIGWKGTIQDNLCYLYPDYEIIGFYMGLQPFLSAQPPNSKKYGYLDHCPLRHTVLFTVRPLEMLCSSLHGSVTAYAWEDGKAQAVRKKDGGEDAAIRQYSIRVQERAREEAAHAARLAKEGGKKALRESRHGKKHAQRCAYRFIAYPDREAVRAYFALRHNEEFGEGRYVRAAGRLRAGLLLQAAVSPSGRQRLKGYLKEVSWPQGYFVKYGMYPALLPYNYLLRRYLKKRQT